MSFDTGMAEKSTSLTSTQPCCRFSLVEIQSATKDFDDELVIGKGGFGRVYKGSVRIEETSHVVAIKRLGSESDQGEHEFRAEIEMLSKLRHHHLVSLIGYCNDNNEMILVYAYMPNGTLYHHLHKTDAFLSWAQRLKIAVGASRGLEYLHTGFGNQKRVIHRDVKSSNILLDENWEAMISDFGLSKLGPSNQSSSFVDASVKGTFGYLDPEYFRTGKLTRKTDVYAFGVVLFELLSGRLAVDKRNSEYQHSLVRWAQKCVKERKLDQMLDPTIRGTISPKCLKGFARIADRCLRSIIKERPTMAEVVVSLQALLELQHRHDNPAQPSGFSWKVHKYLVPTTKQNAVHDEEVDYAVDSLRIFPVSKPNDVALSDKKAINVSQDESGTSSTNMDSKLKRFMYDDLRLATKDFENDCAQGYKGWISKTTFFPSEENTGLPIAVKRIECIRRAHQLDIKTFKAFNHPNLVELIGRCLNGTELFLVYLFMPNGNLKDLLHTGGIARLPLVTKMKIAVGIARGIVFLYEAQYQEGTLSRSLVDTHKILMDEDFTAKLSDYDVVQIVDGRYTRNTRAFGIFHWTQLQSNLSAFEVVFAEVLTGRQISNENEFQQIDDLFIQHGKVSLVHVAKACFEICNEVDAESEMLRILEEYEQYIPTCQKEELTLPLSKGFNLVEGVSRGHIVLQDTVARQ